MIKRPIPHRAATKRKAFERGHDGGRKIKTVQRRIKRAPPAHGPENGSEEDQLGLAVEDGRIHPRHCLQVVQVGEFAARTARHDGVGDLRGHMQHARRGPRPRRCSHWWSSASCRDTASPRRTGRPCPWRPVRSWSERCLPSPRSCAGCRRPVQCRGNVRTPDETPSRPDRSAAGHARPTPRRPRPAPALTPTGLPTVANGLFLGRRQTGIGIGTGARRDRRRRTRQGRDVRTDAALFGGQIVAELVGELIGHPLGPSRGWL